MSRIKLFLSIIISGLFVQIQAMEAYDTASDDGSESGLSRIDVSDTSDSAASSAAGSAQTTPNPAEFNPASKWRTVEDDSADGESSSDSEDEQDESKIEQQISENLGTTRVKIKISDTMTHKVSAGEHLYWSLVALARPLDDHAYVIWKHGEWEKREFTIHKDGAISPDMLSKIIKMFGVGSKILDKKYDLSVLDAALIMALWCRDLQIMSLLLMSGAIFDPKKEVFQQCLLREYEDGQSALHRVALEAFRFKEVFYSLIAAISVLARESHYKTSKIATIPVIVAAKNSFTMTDNDSRSPLHYFCMAPNGFLTTDERRKMGLVLLNGGALFDLEDEADKTALDYARATEKPELVELFESMMPKAVSDASDDLAKVQLV